VRDYAAKLAEKDLLSSSEAIEQTRERGMAEMSEKFIAGGAEVYVEEEKAEAGFGTGGDGAA
jgi:hypothetical protein